MSRSQKTNDLPGSDRSCTVNSPVCIDSGNPLYHDIYRRSIEEPQAFWGELAEQLIDWDKPWDTVVDDSNRPFTKWYVGGQLNACYNALDRHVQNNKGNKVALIHDSPMTNTIRRVTYNELYEKVSRLAGGLKKLGVKKRRQSCHLHAIDSRSNYGNAGYS